MPIVIAGAGIIGLYTAISLAQKGYPVHVVDRYAGKFTRPGVVAIAAGETIAAQLREINVNIDIPLSNSYPETYNISAIQEVLYKEAEKLRVKFTPAHFESIEDKAIKVEGQLTPINCDLLIDCTGESRAIINHVNSSNPKEVFKISQIADNPVKAHFIAFITMSKEDAKELSSYNGAGSVVNEVKMREALRSQGWNQNDIPEWDMRRWELSGGTKARFSCYFELPDDLARASSEEQQAWLATLLKLKSGKKIDFIIEPGSLNFGAFKVDPKKVTNPIYQEESIYRFPIVACGDALMSAEYRKGTGITNGIISANGLVNSIRTDNYGKLLIDSNTFYLTLTHTSMGQFNTQGCIQKHEKEVTELYTTRKNKLASIDNQIINLEKYLKAHSIEPQDEVIKRGLFFQANQLKQSADPILRGRKYKEASPIYEAALKACKILENDPSSDQSEQINLYNLESRIYSNLETIYRNLGNKSQAVNYLQKSINACQCCLRILESISPSQQKLLEESREFYKKLEEKNVSYNIQNTQDFKERMKQIHKESLPTINANIQVEVGQALFISGSSFSLGEWQNAIRMEYKNDHWEFKGEVPPGTEFKLLIGGYEGEKLRPVNTLEWENDPNRKMENEPIQIREANFGGKNVQFNL